MTFHTICTWFTIAACSYAALPYETSFETIAPGAVDQLDTNDVRWLSDGDGVVVDSHAKTGSQSLRLAGGADKSVELHLRNGARMARGLQFHAERWTQRDPFQIRVSVQQAGEWTEIANLDHRIVVGRSFRSDVRVPLPAGGISAIRLSATTADAGGILIDDLTLLATPPKPAPKIAHEATVPIRRVLQREDLFVAGTQDTHTFRIPALITAKNGDLIACADARRDSAGDLITERNIDIVIRRSADNGATWGSMEAIADFPDGQAASDASFILDRVSGEIFCFYNYMNQDTAPKEFRFYLQSSTDHGKTWSSPRDLTDQLSPPSWKMDFKFITSGRGIQRRNGQMLHTLVNLQRGLYVFGSDDHGKTWRTFDTAIKPGDESKVIERADESLMINARVNRPGYRYVHTAPSPAGPWSGYKETGLADPGCNGSIIRYTDVKDGYAKNRLLFANASSIHNRRNLAVRISYDEGKTWSDGRVLETDQAAYASLSILADGSIGILYEPGYKSIRFARITLEDLTDGKDALPTPYRIR